MPHAPCACDGDGRNPDVHFTFGSIDFLGCHSQVEQLLPDLADRLRRIADFEVLCVVLPNEESGTARLYTVRVAFSGRAPAPPETRTIILVPGDQELLAAAAEGRIPGFVLDRLDRCRDFPALVTALRGLGQESACLLPIAAASGRAGLMGLASPERTCNACDQCDGRFLQRIGGEVALAIDDIRHCEEAFAGERQLQAEREHLRNLLELSNAVVPARDPASLLTVIAPYLQRVVSHDAASLYFLADAGRRLGIYAISPIVIGWTDALAAMIHPDTEPLATWLAERRAVDIDVETFDWKGREAIRSNVEANGVKHLGFIPLATPRGLLGFLVLDRRTSRPFTEQELDRSSQAAAQIALALENALAFDEIAALKDRLSRENIYLEEEIRGAQHFGEIVGESKPLKRILNQVATVAATDAAVLLLGETGTGKELIARAIHAAGDRGGRALVTVNCATSPAGLLESEWFGHERGAFTGALAQKIGRFELAHQGTLFLDEIGDVPLELQAKLLRALQDREIERLGSTRTIRVDFRLIAATNRDLEDMVAKREFRSDLYYRLNVFPVRIPPLRERREDIPLLVRYFTQRFAKRLRRPIESVSRESMEMLCRWSWPGNVRELQNVIERAVILSSGSVLIVSRSEFESASPPASSPVTLQEAEREHILRALEQTGWVIGGAGGAAVRLGLKRTSLVSTMRRLGIVRPKPQTRQGGELRPS
jgi:formate hydrogenlyase transcriptional activator